MLAAASPCTPRPTRRVAFAPLPAPQPGARRRRTAAERRAQRARAEARAVGALLRCFASVDQHRGGRLPRLSRALQAALRPEPGSSAPAAGPVSRAAAHAPGARETFPAAPPGDWTPATASTEPFPEPGDAGYVDYARQQYEPLPHCERRRRQRLQALRNASELLQESALEAKEHINPEVTQLVSLSSDLLFSTQMLQPVPEDAAEPEEALLFVDALPLVNGLDVDDVALGSPVSALYALVPDSLGTAPLEEPVPPAEEDENMLSVDDFLATLQPEVSDPASPLVPRGIEPGDNVITNFTESHPLVGTWDYGDENEYSFTVKDYNSRLRIHLRGASAQLDAIATGVWIADMGLSGSGSVQIDGLGTDTRLGVFLRFRVLEDGFYEYYTALRRNA